MSKYLWELPTIEEPGADAMVPLVEGVGKGMGKITIGQLLGLQQERLNRACPYCGSRGKYDVRGNCGACGAPQENEQ